MPTIKPDTDWTLLPAEEVEGLLGTQRSGLSAEEAEARLEEHGPNELEEEPPTSGLTILLRQFRSPLIYILLAATVATLVLQEYVDSGVIAVVLALNAAIGFFQERKAEDAIRALAGMVAPRARVRREGRVVELDSRELVPGDLVLLESGQRVPADVRLVSAAGLSVDESLLTGESSPVRKSSDPLPAPEPLADRLNMAFAGTVVTMGRATGYVVSTGAHTELGGIAESMRQEVEPVTPLQQRMEHFAHIVGLAVVGSAVVAGIIGVVVLRESLAAMFMVAVALAVAAVPEGLPVVFTIALAVGVRRMARRHAIIRRLPAVETLGSTTVIGSDKTGTLTENRMTVEEVRTRVGTYRPEEEVDLDESPALRLALLAGVLSNEASLRGEEAVGDPTEAALLVSAGSMGLDHDAARSSHRVLSEIHFEPERRYSASLVEEGDHRMVLVKGAPERVLEMCTAIEGRDGPEDIDPEWVREEAEEMAAGGLRVLAMAYRRGEGLDSLDDDPTELVFLGLQGMRDPPRQGVAAAVEGCQKAGMRVIMITGDHASTALAIAAELGIADEGSEVITGVDLDELDEGELSARVAEVSVYARVSPQHKLRVVKALRERGEVVAVTGDGVNDAPALRVADIGIAMGRSGTDVAREASDMVLTDDNFVSIYAAVEEGRVSFDNVRKVSFFLISSGAALVVLILATLVAGWPLPMLPAQILWLNLVTNGLQDVALAFEPGEEGVLRRRPRPRREGIISPLLWERTLVAGLVMAAGTMWMFNWALRTTGSLTQAQSVALTTMVIYQAFHVGNSRSENRSLFQMSPISNPFLLIAVVVALGIHIGALRLPFTQFILRVEPLDPGSWARIVAVAASVLVVVELHKWVRRRFPPRERH